MPSEPLELKPIEDIRYWTYNESDRGYPTYWAWWGEQIHFWPIPNGNYDCRFDYIADTDRPRYTRDGEGWKFENLVFNPTSEEFEFQTLTDSYTNEWLTNAPRMLRVRAKLDLYANFYDDDSNAQKMAALLKGEEREVRMRTHNFQSHIGIQPLRI